MTHSDPDALAMMAMGESDLPQPDVRHIESCDQCLSEMRSLHRVADLARSGRPDESFPAPSPEVWDRISAALDLDPTYRPADRPAGSRAGHTSDPSTSDSTTPDPSTFDSPPSGPSSSDSATSDSSQVAEAGRPMGAPDEHTAVGRRHRVPRRRVARRRGRATRVVASVVAVVVVAAAVTTIVVLQRAVPSVIAEARLVPPPGGDSASGDAIIEQGPDGVRDIRVDIDSNDAISGDSYREVWLISTDLSRLVSLGTLDGTEGRFAIPQGVDLTEFPIVDISAEPLDGDPLHSGDSIVRGTLDS